MVGGLEQTPLKYENGAKLFFPSNDIVDTSAMGLGNIDPIIILWFS
jgi:hypothetical protein